MCNSSTPPLKISSFSLFLLALLFGCLAGCVSVPELSRQEVPVAPQAAKAPAPALAVPDGYIEPVPPLPEKGYLLKELAKDVYFFSNGVYNNLFVVTSEGVILADPIRGAGPLLKRAIGEVTTFPVKVLIYTHPHLDHIGDASLFARGAKIIAHQETQKLLQRYRDPARPVPQITFGEKSVIELGGVRVELIYPGDGHGKGNIMIYLPQKKILMFVGVTTPKSVPPRNFETVDIYGQIVGLKRALQLDFETYVAGHRHRPGTRGEMEEVLKYYLAAKRANAEALRRVDKGAVMQKSLSKDSERRRGEYEAAVAEECYRLLQPAWKPRLQGFEAFARSHCDTWTDFHRTHKAP